jgi:hypothetical protein
MKIKRVDGLFILKHESRLQGIMSLILVFCPDIFFYKEWIKNIDCLNVRSVEGVVVTVIVWWLDLQLPMQSVPITTDVVSSNPDQDEVNNICW